MEEVKAWACSECGSIFYTKRKTSKCEKNCIKKKDDREAKDLLYKNTKNIADEIRLNLTNPVDISDLIKSYTKKYLNRSVNITNITFRFGMQSNSHSAPIGKKTNWSGRDSGKPTGYLGWSGQVTGNTTLYNNNIGGDGFCGVKGFSNLFEYNNHFYINGFNTGSGSGGSSFNYSFIMFLDDFPKLKVLNSQYINLNRKRSAYISEESRLNVEAIDNIVESDEQVVNLEDGLRYLRFFIDKKKQALRSRRNAVMNGKEYQTAIIIDKKFDYDITKYESLDTIFGG